ncbi:MAG: hypothetical protein KJ047_01045 [Anaerolineae bacterium]|nr:hypothetical protein [Anaerolineae bacterium]
MFEHFFVQHPMVSSDDQMLWIEAVETIERCLTRGEDTGFIAFMEAQITSRPPRVDLLRAVADDLLTRLLALRQQRDDVRDRVVRMLLDEYDIDIAGLYPADAPEQYERLSVDEIVSPALRSLSEAAAQDLPLIRKTVQASLEMVRQLSADIRLTERLHQTVADWLIGLSATSSRSLLTQRSRPDRKDETQRLH